jgi:hypothetical protein
MSFIYNVTAATSERSPVQSLFGRIGLGAEFLKRYASSRVPSGTFQVVLANVHSTGVISP